MAFTYDLTTDRGRVRLKIADIDSTAYAFEDDEIDEFISEGGSNNAAAALALKVLIASKARRMKRASLAPGVTIDDTAQVAELRELLKLYGGAGMPTLRINSQALRPSDIDFEEPVT